MPVDRELRRLRNGVLLFSAVAWIVLIAGVGPAGALAHCATVRAATTPNWSSLEMLLSMNRPVALAAGWFMMMVAMMAPAVIPPLQHVHVRSFCNRRARSIALFTTGYAGIWITVGAALTASQLTATLLAPESCLPAAAAGIAALIWQASPVKQRCLNRCHAHTELAAFGAAADRDACRFGLRHGLWCAGSCWALMLFPMLLLSGHVLAMAAVTLLIVSERLERPMPPRWAWRGFGKLTRILVRQVRLRLHAIRPDLASSRVAAH